MIADDDFVQLSDYSFNVCEALEATIQEKTDGLGESTRTALEELGMCVNLDLTASALALNLSFQSYRQDRADCHDGGKNRTHRIR